MLPDWPVFKEDFQKALLEFMQLRLDVHLSNLANIAQYRVFEGTETAVREGAKERSFDFVEGHGELEVRSDEISNLTLSEILRRLDTMAYEMAAQRSKHFYKTLNQEAEHSGRTVTGPLSPETLLELFNSIDIDFDDTGRPVNQELHIHPDQLEALKAVQETIQNDPEWRRRFDEVDELKREEWRAREANRRLD